MKTAFQHFTEKMKTSAWTIPSILSLAAIALAQFSLWVDRIFSGIPIPFLTWFEETSLEGSRAFLSTIAASMLAIAGVSFSSIMVTMALASQQFGPRLLRNFIKDKCSQAVLGVLLGTFVYCIFVIRRIREGESGILGPQFSSLIALILTLVSLAAFIRFIHHIITVIQAEEIVSDAHGILEQTISAVFPDSDDRHPEYCANNREDSSGIPVTIAKTGYVQAVNFEELVKTAHSNNSVFAIDVSSGHFVSGSKVVLRILDGPKGDERLVKEVRKCFYIGSVRTPEQDFEYGIRQLVEVALRALSPGINDPYTAMNCIDYLGAGLQLAFSRALPGSIHRDEDGTIRLYSLPITYRGMVEASFDQIRQASRERSDVSCRLLEVLAETAEQARNEEQEKALKVQADLVYQDTLPTLHNDYDRGAIEEKYSAFAEMIRR